MFSIWFHYSANNAFRENKCDLTQKFIFCAIYICFFAHILNSSAPNSVLLTSGPFVVWLHLHVPHICFSPRDCWCGEMQRTRRQTLSHACQPPYPPVCHVNDFKCCRFASLSWRPKGHLLLPRCAAAPKGCSPRKSAELFKIDEWNRNCALDILLSSSWFLLVSDVMYWPPSLLDWLLLQHFD